MRQRLFPASNSNILSSQLFQRYRRCAMSFATLEAPPKTRNNNDIPPTQPAAQRIDEGSCHMCFDAGEETTVFYNPVQVQNRDLSVLMIARYAERRKQEFLQKQEKRRLRRQQQQSEQATTEQQPQQEFPGLCILDALAASGLRSMRYWKECGPHVHHITVNDLDPAAHERATRNLASNGLAGDVVDSTTSQRERGIRIQTADATHIMYNSRASPPIPGSKGKDATDTSSLQWDVIDLDPYGSAAPFLDAAVQAVKHNGLLNITCTDMAALGGSHPETCCGRYNGAMPIPRAPYLQEMAVRILLYTISVTAARYGRIIHPILSVGMDFYVRVFVEIRDSKVGVQQLSLRTGHVLQSTRCPSFHVMPVGQLGGKKGNVYQPGRLTVGGTCTETGGPFKMAGPLWIGPMHDADYVKDALDSLSSLPHLATKERLRGLLTSCLDELPDVPLYYQLPVLASTLHSSAPPLVVFKSALVNAGYRVSGYHKEPNAIKTNAPDAVVWDIMRAWVKQQPGGGTSKKQTIEGSAAAAMLSKECQIKADFTIVSSVSAAQAKLGKVTRFPMNPQANWGPKPRATGVKRTVQGTPKQDNPVGDEGNAQRKEPRIDPPGSTL